MLIAANSGLRVGEQRQLRWSDVQIERHKVNCEEHKLPRIHVRAEALKEVKRLCKEFGFTVGMLKGSLAKGRAKSS